MRRNRSVKYKDGIIAVDIAIKIRTKPGFLVRKEMDDVSTELCDKIMGCLSGTTYVNAPLSEIKVK